MRDQLTRREMLKVGVLGAGLTLSQYLRLHAAETPQGSKRSAIFIFMEGGPSHQDTFDLKPNAPADVRGDFNPISTNVSGVQICEHLPMLAKRADKYAIIRGVSHNVADHGLGKKYLLTGNKPSQTVSYPEYGSVASHGKIPRFRFEDVSVGYVHIKHDGRGLAIFRANHIHLTPLLGFLCDDFNGIIILAPIQK